jgi:predicted branched-subunit amino acid permease
MTQATDTQPVDGRFAPARAGVLAAAPVVAGLAPFALVIGATAAARGVAWSGWTGSVLVFAGSAQLAVLKGADAGVAVAVATGLLLNARLVVYSASLRDRWQTQPRWFRAVAAAFVVDPTWALAEHHAGQTGAGQRDERAFFLAAALTLLVGWSTLIAAGSLLGGRTGRVDLDVAVPVCLAALLGPALRTAGGRAAVAVGALAALATMHLPTGAGPLAAIVVAGAAGARSEAVTPGASA